MNTNPIESQSMAGEDSQRYNLELFVRAPSSLVPPNQPIQSGFDVSNRFEASCAFCCMVLTNMRLFQSISTVERRFFFRYDEKFRMRRSWEECGIDGALITWRYNKK